MLTPWLRRASVRAGKSGVYMRNVLCGAALVAAAVFFVSGAEAQLVISTAPTGNVSCTNGDCETTQDFANLNVDDLKRLLKKFDVSLTNRFSQSIDVKAPIFW